MNKSSVKVRVSGELLLHALRFPEGTELVAVLEDGERFLSGAPVVDLYLYHPDLPEVKDGCLIPECLPTWISKHYCVFEDWNLDKWARQERGATNSYECQDCGETIATTFEMPADICPYCSGRLALLEGAE